ncbi:MAG: NfeD family protein [Betaproteobacteria bacterium]|nr:NfeD family protein [Betaproteobacteria bacterium]MBI2509345.1 NfeD family protein [Betaproteobacteria bacterium]
MEGYLVWIIAGFALAIIELMSGTFYLLVLGIGAFAGSAVAWSGGALFAQCATAGAIALVGTYLVWEWRKRQKAAKGAQGIMLDLGQSVVFEAWTDPKTGAARVKYRGASWDAVIGPGREAQPGDVLYITGQDGQMLKVSAAKP